jgi:3-phosphoshikimate 1-carboxyvinyltransferase
MLKFFGARLSVKKGSVLLDPAGELSSPGAINIPGDISSAAFLMVLGSIIPGARIVIEGVSLNPGRTGVIKVLKRMGAKIRVRPCKNFFRGKGFEPAGDISVSAASLKGTLINRRQIPSLIDELPVIMVAACFAKGRTVIRGAGELRVKETDRINSISANLKAMSADIRVSGSGTSEDIIINGKGSLSGAELRSFSDHRTAMSMVVAALAARGNSTLDDISCVNKSFPVSLPA